MKIALVYDRVNKFGGAERVLLALHEIWPEAPLYTAVYNPQTAPWAKKFKVIPSFLNKFPFARKRHEAYPHLMPFAFESFNFDKYDVVISVTSEAAKGIITKPKTLHICYCLTPTRYLWSGYKDYFSSSVFRLFSSPLVAYLRRWDKIAAQRPDVYFATCENVKKRIKKYYGRESEVVYPLVDIKKFKRKHLRGEIRKHLRGGAKTKLLSSEVEPSRDDYFLLVSRLVGYKRVDLAIEAFNKLGLPLKVIGTGTQLGGLKRMAKDNIQFLNELTGKRLLSYYQRCQAVIFPQEEDFGLVPLEAQACGKPVIAYQGGGVLETVIKGKTGLFFSPQTAEALARVVKKFDLTSFDPQACRQNAEKFAKERFKKEIKKFVEQEWRKKK